MNERKEWGWVCNGEEAPVPRDYGFGWSPYLWWRRGATDEHFIEREGYSEENLALRNALDALVQIRGTANWTNEQLVRMLAEIWIPGDLNCRTEMTGAVPATARPEDGSCSTDSGTESEPLAPTVE